MSSSSREERSFVVHEHLLRVLANNLDSNVCDEAAVLGEGLAGETSRVVADEGELSDLGDKPGKNTLA